jgi:hypothetical protein
MPKGVQINGMIFKGLPIEEQKYWIKNTVPPGKEEVLNDQQVFLCLQICLGKNICLLGPPGVGKTLALNRAQYLMRILFPDKTFDRTATTGMASSHLDNGKTIFDLLKTGPDSCLSYLPQFREKLMSPRIRKIIEELEILHIDEASMLSEQAFNYLESAAREIRKNRTFMGGIQIIVSGDIFQLSVIPGSEGAGLLRKKRIELLSILENLPGSFDVNMLTQNMRSRDDAQHKALITALIQKCPIVRKRAIELLHEKCYKSPLYVDDAISLSRKTGMVILTPTNCKECARCNLYNQTFADRLRKENPGEPIEIGKAKPLHTWATLPAWVQTLLRDKAGLKIEEDNILSQKRFEVHLSLYPGEPIMLRKNTEEYKNGDKCEFVSVSSDGSCMTVKRYSDGAMLKITKCDLTSEFVSNIGFEAFPVIKDAAMTIHKAQGCTLESGVIFDPFKLCAFKKHAPRMTYVVVSRTRSLKNIVMTEKMEDDAMTSDEAQADILRLWELEYMADYPTITLEELNAAFA